ncbi:MAG: secondary thiamine-phosphate synthase enzyme YjbQ [Alkalibacterium gilvum]|uniref:Secondary thiamine-phosphate synthase enzyme n=1 Tax=Alkalibacterium gilvum TaxID=1130080 RepID=A0A1H6TA33_9LACT|nr:MULTISPECIES: secondary thiamine-phosphate synthase enzyme YjbQ [Alkalibacterium]MDN6409630.1 secondary thiamine-phosphate synthase enzyme YjbQ [Tetragenococcus halophilus]MDN6294405.1 secondary thiamine-phosphate synthase enzyme YjbQ [Alkalibacterium sp.]MDN6296067.1 secondary thiamine-phosphate synthase enzyme YjbQ [Alkalibacterium sp.]MDN6398047.1 secondary thiamine-phosphate synthase enzyme YjbQ [Alkalibacterium sp.]MDN6729920.1 secondary thiamine-phosphate synthase enzyme YjbQ [Alkalib
MSYVKKVSLSTRDKQELKSLDTYLNEALEDSGIKEGIMLVYCPHTTAGITINENADPDVRIDLKRALNDTFPNHDYFVHMEGNSDGHLKSSLVGASESLIIHEGKIIFGTWQSVYFAEFDGPRTRTFYIKILEG